MQVLDGPTAVDQFGGQPIQQLGVAGRRSGSPEVAGRVHDAGAEVMLPDSIDDHPGGQRVVLQVELPQRLERLEGSGRQ